MFYSTTDGQYINEGQAFTIDGNQYAANWLNLSTPEEKSAIGLEEVIATNSPKSDIYYWVSSTLDKATITYTNTPKDLTEVKANAVSQVNATAYSILLPSDWMAVMASETGTPAINAATDVDGVASAVNVTWSLDPNQPKVGV